jgi:3-oxochol-4-en-24-oyl-CoA dehydrogenase
VNLELTEDQQMMRETFARFLNEQSSLARVRAAMPAGFDRALWDGLAKLGAFSLRVPEVAGGLGLGILDATLLMEEVGRTLASGPIAESLVAARMVGSLELGRSCEVFGALLQGQSVITFARDDIAHQPVQWVAGGAVADGVVAFDGDQTVLLHVTASDRRLEPSLASTPIAQLSLAGCQRTVLSTTADGKRAFAQMLEEWKLLMAAALSGLAREAIRLAAAYACERSAFGQRIGTYQGISHPLADLIVDVDGGKYLTWRAIRDIADGQPNAGAEIALAAWWNIQTAGRAVAQALHTFGGYGLTMEYDIHLYNLRAKAWPLTFGDPAGLLEQAGRRLYGAEKTELPHVGVVPIDFDLGQEARALADEVDTFFKKTLTPELKDKAHYSWEGHDPGVHRKLAEAQLLFPSWPKALGGREASPYAVTAMFDIWHHHGWSGFAAGVTGMVGSIIRAFGSEELKREVLSRIAAGEVICSLGYSEPSCGSDVFAAQTRATRQGDGWRIDGQKMFTSGADQAEYVLMLTRTNPAVPKHKGLTMFIVPLQSPGVSVQAVHTFQDERTNITYYDGVLIKDSYRLGEVDGGVKTMSSALELEHSGGFATTQRHMAQAAEDFCRVIQHRGRPLIEATTSQMRLARARAHALIAEVLGQRALWAAVNRVAHPAFGPMTKLFSSEKFLTDSSDLLDLTAPYSLSKRAGPAAFLNQCYRHAQGTTIYGGTSEVHRSLIAERYLGLPRTRA